MNHGVNLYSLVIIDSIYHYAPGHFLLFRKVLSIAKEQTFHGNFWGVLHLEACVSLVAGDWARDSTAARHYFSTYIAPTDWHQGSVH